jgi:hypothetical protein
MPSMTWEYVSSVMLMLAWPGSFWTRLGCLPAMRRIVAQVCPRSGNRGPDEPAFLRIDVQPCVIEVVAIVVGPRPAGKIDPPLS